MDYWVVFFLGVVACQLLLIGYMIWDMRRLQ